jgi:LPS export ABC transporter protein LptC
MASISRKYAKGAVLITVLGLSAVLIVGIWKGKTRKEERATPGEGTSGAEMMLTDMDYTEMEGGKRVWTLNASEAKYYQNEHKSILTNVHLTFLLKDGEEINLKSREGVLFAGTKNIELWGAVHADLPRGYKISTERVFYEHKNRRVSSETPVHLSGPQVRLDGARWEYIIPEYRAVIEGGVQATVLSFYFGTSRKQ